VVRQSLVLSMLCSAALLGIAGCAPTDVQAQAGGPTFMEMPLNQAGLVGATPQLLDAAFGKPAILRTEGTAQVWLYHDAGCGLNLVLYPDNTGTPRVAMAAPTADGADPAACSASLARDHVAALSGQNGPDHFAALSRPIAQNGVVQPNYAAAGIAQPVSDVLPPVTPSAGPSVAGPSVAGPSAAGPSAAGPALDGPGSAL
jgi:hypothetical protein